MAIYFPPNSTSTMCAFNTYTISSCSSFTKMWESTRIRRKITTKLCIVRATLQKILLCIFVIFDSLEILCCASTNILFHHKKGYPPRHALIIILLLRNFLFFFWYNSHTNFGFSLKKKDKIMFWCYKKKNWEVISDLKKKKKIGKIIVEIIVNGWKLKNSKKKNFFALL